jgi:hypothetical protein
MVVNQLVKKFPADGYLPSLQEPATKTSPEPQESISHGHSRFL